MQFQESCWIRKFSKAEFLVEAMCIPSCEHKSPQPLKICVSKDKRHKPFGQSLAEIRLNYEYICKISESCLVRNYTSETYLIALMKNAKTQRTLYGSPNHLTRDAW